MPYHFEDIILEHEIENVKTLLRRNGLKYESNVDQTLGLFDDDQLIATGSIDHNVIKMLAVDFSYQGEQLLSKMLTQLISKLHDQNIFKYFVFSKPENKKIFLDYNLFVIYEDNQIVMFENKVDTIVEKLNEIKNDLKLNRGTIASIVMNCNPITNGHLYLIETCSKQNDNVIIFLVQEDRSVFPLKVRLKLVKKATRHLKNVFVLPSTEYIISKATFPTYFIKKVDDATKLYTTLDISIFKNYFMHILNIDFRYVGTEPLDPLTNLYNEKMKEILGEKLIIVERLKQEGQVVSASFIRELAKNGKYEEIKTYVPKATYQFLKSRKGQKLL